MTQDFEKVKARKKLYYVANKTTMDARNRKWQQDNKERVVEYMRKYREPIRELVNKRERELHLKDKNYLKRNRIARLSKLEMIAGRPKSSVCEICGNGNSRIVFDHEHKTGQFRGWICSHCNTGLGYARDSVEVLERMVQYLKRANDNPTPSFISYERAKAIGYRGASLEGLKDKTK